MVLGLLFDDMIEERFYNAVTVSVMLIAYGIFFLLAENRHRRPKIQNYSQLHGQTLLLIGLFQALAMIPEPPVPVQPFWVPSCWDVPAVLRLSSPSSWPFPPCWAPVR